MTKKLKIADKEFDLVGGGIVSVSTPYGMKKALNLKFKNNLSFEESLALFNSTENTSKILLVDDSGAETIFTTFIHLDGTISVNPNGVNNTYTIQLLEDDDLALHKTLENTRNDIESLNKQLDSASKDYEDVKKQLKESFETIDTLRNSIGFTQDALNSMLMNRVVDSSQQ